MSRKCHFCDKRKTTGGSIVRRGLAKKQGGIGMHVVKNTKRTFKPNLQSARIKTPSGPKKVLVCTACIRSGMVEKA